MHDDVLPKQMQHVVPEQLSVHVYALLPGEHAVHDERQQCAPVLADARPAGMRATPRPIASVFPALRIKLLRVVVVFQLSDSPSP